MDGACVTLTKGAAMAIDPVTKNYITPTKSATSSQVASSNPSAAGKSTSTASTAEAQTPAATYTKSPEAAKAAAAAPAKTEAGAVHAVAKSDKEIKDNIASVKAGAKSLEIGGSKTGSTGTGATGVTSSAKSDSTTTVAAQSSGTTAQTQASGTAAVKTSGTTAKAGAEQYGNKNPVNKQEIMAAASEMKKSLKDNVNSAVAGAALGQGTQYQKGELPKVITKQVQTPKNSSDVVDVMA